MECMHSCLCFACTSRLLLNSNSDEERTCPVCNLGLNSFSTIVSEGILFRITSVIYVVTQSHNIADDSSEPTPFNDNSLVLGQQNLTQPTTHALVIKTYDSNQNLLESTLENIKKEVELS